MENLQQSEKYQKYIRALGWNVDLIDETAIFRKIFPVYGALAKIQRTSTLPDAKKLINYIKDNRVKILILEPEADVNQKKFTGYINILRKNGVKIDYSPYIPTKTIRINLKPTEEQIFKSFSEAKRRAVRKAIKNGITVKINDDIDSLIKIKNKSAGMFGFMTTFGIKKFWQILGPENSKILLAYSYEQKLIGGVLLIFHKNISFYWIAGCIQKGKKLYAPTLLVWEAIKLSKFLGYEIFDFTGVFDERIPTKYSNDWKGFTKFKEGFGGEELYYPIAL